MKRLFPVLPGMLVISFLACHIHSTAQKKPKENVYLFDANWKPASANNAKYFISITPADSGFEWDYYRVDGPLVRVETHTTADGDELNGPAYLYDEAGDLDSLENFSHGKKQGKFYRYGPGLKRDRVARMEYEYQLDSLIKTKDLMAGDSDATHSDNALKAQEAVNKEWERSNLGLSRKQIMAKKIDTAVQLESFYPGGLPAWSKFLTHNLRYPEEAVNRKLSGVIWIRFAVDSDGKTGEFYVSRSANYWLDREALRVIKQSGDWVPAYDHGKMVKSFKQQPVSMRLQ